LIAHVLLIFDFFRDKEVLLEILEVEKKPYLFSSAVLLKLLESTSSSKTKISIISLISPRLVDPQDMLDQFLSIFRFVEEKNQVEECLRRRMQNLKGSIFIKKVSSLSRFGRSKGGRGSMHSPGQKSTGHVNAVIEEDPILSEVIK